MSSILDRAEQPKTSKASGTERGGDLVAIAGPRSWFTYYYWLDDTLAPDFARTIDIHRKIGYDPAELFLDPELRWPRLSIAAYLLRKKLGLRGLLNVIPLDPGLVSRVRMAAAPRTRMTGLCCHSRKAAVPGKTLDAVDVHDELLRQIKA